MRSQQRIITKFNDILTFLSLSLSLSTLSVYVCTALCIAYTTSYTLIHSIHIHYVYAESVKRAEAGFSSATSLTGWPSLFLWFFRLCVCVCNWCMHCRLQTVIYNTIHIHSVKVISTALVVLVRQCCIVTAICINV